MTKIKRQCAFCHDVIETQHVFSENNQVYLKNDSNSNRLNVEEWSPINFQWIPVTQLKERLVHL
ncbi:hypothetical protein [Zobellia alginiliquefaciens]|uniref:hypothetical protein n=1 Tax=Zobellia alginiliquefaciens TaxID=3032586 RepID=UPI0023E3930F|nr:hypothetical protein [Zobellia alginiliquefaciens]